MIDLRLCQYDHFWNLSNIANSRINSNGYIYPVIDYHKDSPNSYISNSDKVVRADYMLPAMYYNTLVDEVMNETGFLFVNKLASYSDDIIIPYSGNNLLRNKQGSRYEATFRASKDTLLNVLMPATPSVSFGNWVFFDTLDVGNNCGSYWSAGNYTKFTNGLGDNIFLRFADKIRFTVEYDLNFEPSLIDDVMSVVFTTNLNAYLNIPDRTSLNMLDIFINTYAGQPINISGEVTLETYDTVTWLGGWDKNSLLIFTPFYSQTLLAGSYIKIKDVEILQQGEIVYSNQNVSQVVTETGFEQNNFITISSLLLDITQADFIKGYIQQFNILPIINYITETVTFYPFSEIVSNLSKAYDWSNKIDLTEDYELIFILDSYAQRNKFTYSEDGSESKPIGTDSEIIIDNNNLELETDTAELPYAATNTVERLQGNVINQIGVFSGGKYSEAKVPRILYIEKKSASDIGGNVTYKDLENNTQVISNDIPLTWFIDNNKSENLGWGNNLLDTHYQLISSIIENAKIVSMYVRLTAADISQLDFSIPVWIDKFESYFYLSAVKGFSYTENKSTLVELVKLNING